jgi:hypothetical protein
MIKLTDNDMKIAQDMFDKGTVGVINQGCQSMDNTSVCQYRQNNQANDSIRCAIGHCIADEDYNINMESKIASGLKIFESYSSNIRIFMDKLQTCHDTVNQAKFVDSFYSKCMRLAFQYDLDMTKMMTAYQNKF